MIMTGTSDKELAQALIEAGEALQERMATYSEVIVRQASNIAELRHQIVVLQKRLDEAGATITHLSADLRKKIES